MPTVSFGVEKSVVARWFDNKAIVAGPMLEAICTQEQIDSMKVVMFPAMSTDEAIGALETANRRLKEAGYPEASVSEGITVADEKDRLDAIVVAEEESRL